MTRFLMALLTCIYPVTVRNFFPDAYTNLQTYKTYLFENILKLHLYSIMLSIMQMEFLLTSQIVDLMVSV